MFSSLGAELPPAGPGPSAASPSLERGGSRGENRVSLSCRCTEGISPARIAAGQCWWQSLATCNDMRAAGSSPPMEMQQVPAIFRPRLAQELQFHAQPADRCNVSQRRRSPRAIQQLEYELGGPALSTRERGNTHLSRARPDDAALSRDDPQPDPGRAREAGQKRRRSSTRRP